MNAWCVWWPNVDMHMMWSLIRLKARLGGQILGYNNMLSICQKIMSIAREGIEPKMFKRGGDDLVSLARPIFTEALNTLGYRQQRRS